MNGSDYIEMEENKEWVGVRELTHLPTTAIYRMFGKARDKQPKEEVIAEASKLSEDVIWIESMGAAFIPMTESEGE